MKSIYRYCVVFASLATQVAFASQAQVTVFMNESPLQGVAVTLNETALGVTDGRGGIAAVLEAGDHIVKISTNGGDYPINFSSAADEDVEISASFSGNTSSDPVVSIRKFLPGGPVATGHVAGNVTDNTRQPIANARVAALGSNYATNADEDGVYVLELPRGTYDVQFSAEGYSEVTIENVRVLADLGVSAAVMLPPQGTVEAVTPGIEEVFVLGVFDPGQDAASVERYATSITNAIDATQLARFGDSDVASALNRAVGVAVVDRSYATVRGLDGRYISGTLNGLLIPSTDPQRRDVQLDLFPTLIVDGIEIQKSYTADKLATTTGGAIMIATKGIPDERIREIGGSLAVNTDFTGDDILNYQGSNDDWLGYDSGLRELPGGVLAATEGGRSLTICDPEIDPVRCTSPEDAAALGVKFQDDYNTGTKEALPDGEASLVLGDRLAAGDNEWGYYLAADYDRTTNDRGQAELSNPIGVTGEYERSRETTAITGYGAVGYEYGDANTLLSKSIYLHNTDDVTRVEDGIDELEDNQINSSILQFVERQFISQAFTGHNEIEFEEGVHELDWQVAYSRTDRDEPDRRQYTYFNNFLSTSAFERRWSDLEEDSFDAGLDYALDWDWGDLSSTRFQIGTLWSDKQREVDQYRFGVAVASPENVDLSIDQNLESEVLPYQNFALDWVRLTANTTDTDSYDSAEEITAFFLNTETDLGESWSVVVGARYEDFDQTIKYPNDKNASSELEFDDWYPAMNLTWRQTDELQYRAGYSQTVSYPGLIERSEAQSFDPDTDDPIFGNPDLQVSTIDNADVRAEYYFSDSESVSLALFYKDIDKPVERAIPDASGSAARGITFINQDSAELYGVELDGTKNLVETDSYLWFISGNVAYIDSEVQLSRDSLRLEGASADGRELQGQSQWLGNFQLGFDHYPSDQTFTLLVNYFDRRIFRVSRGISSGPEYEDSRVLVDITYENLLSDSLTLKASVKNLLNEKVEYSQNGNTIESYQVGTLIGASLTYAF